MGPGASTAVRALAGTFAATVIADQALKAVVRLAPDESTIIGGDQLALRNVEHNFANDPNLSDDMGGKAAVFLGMSGAGLLISGGSKMALVGAGLLIGGGLSNAVELHYRRSVTDMLGIGKMTANVADLACVTGALLLVVSCMRRAWH